MFRPTAMSVKLVLLVGLLALLQTGTTHRYKPAEYRQFFDNVEKEDTDYTRAEADGYEECEDFVNLPQNVLVDEDAENDVTAPNGQHHFMRRHKAKPLEQICAKFPCPEFQQENTSWCGFKKTFIPRGYWIFTTVDTSSPKGFRDAYKRLHAYRSGKNNDRNQKMAFVVPVIEFKWLNPEDPTKVALDRMAINIPAKYQDDAVRPESTDPEVQVLPLNDTILYSRTYGGYREDQGFLDQFDLLNRALERAGITPFPFLKITAAFTHQGYGRQRVEAVVADISSITF